MLQVHFLLRLFTSWSLFRTYHVKRTKYFKLKHQQVQLTQLSFHQPYILLLYLPDRQLILKSYGYKSKLTKKATTIVFILEMDKYSKFEC